MCSSLSCNISEDFYFFRKSEIMPGYNVEEEIEVLSGHIKRIGREVDGTFQVTFKVNIEFKSCSCKTQIFYVDQELFDDDQVANSLESLAGTLKAAKKKKIVTYGPELLLQVRSNKDKIFLDFYLSRA